MIPPHVRGRPADARGAGWRAWYQPANTERDLPKGSKHRPMADFLMSDDLQSVVLDVADEIGGEARGMAIEEGAVETGEYASSFEARAGSVVVVSDPFPNPRVSADVLNTSDHAAAEEFGNSKRSGSRVLGRAGAKFDSPKGG